MLGQKVSLKINLIPLVFGVSDCINSSLLDILTVHGLHGDNVHAFMQQLPIELHLVVFSNLN